jgi:hypothetical protein
MCTCSLQTLLTCTQAQALQQQQGQQQQGGVPGQHDMQQLMMPRMNPRDSLPRGSPPFSSIGRSDEQQYPGVHPPDGASFPSAPFPSFDLRYMLLYYYTAVYTSVNCMVLPDRLLRQLLLCDLAQVSL